jgi:hypothetical protein
MKWSSPDSFEHRQSIPDYIKIHSVVPEIKRNKQTGTRVLPYVLSPCTKVKVKLLLCFNWAPRHEGIWEELKYSSTHSLTPALDGHEWSASHLGRYTPKETAPGTH